MELVDNQNTTTTDNLSNDTQTQDPGTDLTQQTAGEAVQTPKPYQPFANGKERFTVNGKEVEWDWETAKKYASLGNTAYQKMEEAAELRKRTDTAWSQLVELAQKDPETFIRTFSPNYKPQSQPTQGQAKDVAELDPRDLKIQQMEQRLSKLDELEKAYEAQEVEKERVAITKELEDVQTRYSNLKGDEFAIDYIKAQYRKALQNGLDVSLDDVAFQVSQKLKERNELKTQQTQARIEQKRKQAPVNVVSSTADTTSKPMTLEDVKRLAGRL